ncbi:MAG TPA: histidine kinase N-terminal 7TM domain-containing protein, partial [Candidatus Gracilibacteria bacterium]|nr:histidine kinase N-terminal 7TM domain-containing protein [Candidatus Gracilibacteria bacterium]
MNLYTTILYGVSFLLMLTIGTLVLVKNPKAALNQYFFGTTISTIFWMIAMFFGFSSVPHDLPAALVYFRIAFGLSVYPLLTVGFFFYYFPRKTKSPNRVEIYAIHGLAFIFFVLGSFTPLIEESVHMEGNIQVDVFGPLYPGYILFVLGLLVFTIVTVVKKIIQSRGIERR